MSWLLQRPFAALLIALRSKEAERRYRLIGGGSPIFDSTQNQTKALQDELKRRGRDIKVTFSFNYSPPLPEDTITETKEAKKNYLLPISLYPHYSKATTGSNLHYLKKAARKIHPELRFLTSSNYYLHESYLCAFVDRIFEQVQSSESFNDFYLLFSAHGLPLYFLTEGDPYPYQISQTVAGVLSKLNRKDQWAISYQSAVGPLQWLKPSTGDMIKALAQRKIQKLIIIPISFVTDHIETTCEIDIEYRQLAENLGISDFRMTKALECHSGFISALADTVEKSLQSDANDQRRLLSEDTQAPSSVYARNHDVKNLVN
jgi:ferrochelatase